MTWAPGVVPANKGVRIPVIERLLRRTIEDVDGCWIWQGYTFKGYGQITLSAEDGTRLTHQVTYLHFIGDIPEGLELDHLFRVPSCCNPWHLDPVTHAENVRRATIWGLRTKTMHAKTQCRKGHDYTPANLRITASGKRRCRACATESARHKRAERVAV
jgi:hypothetical protein